ncbi:MAG: AAA family ATPase [Candidatus Binatia bacterium]
MKPHTPQLRSFRLKNFKAVRDSGTIHFTPLTAFIGNNGSGKSSIIEGLETFQAIVEEGLDKAMQQWRGFEHIWHQRDPHRLIDVGVDRPCHTNPMSFDFRGRTKDRLFKATMQINMGPGGNEIFIQHERFATKDQIPLIRDATGVVTFQDGKFPPGPRRHMSDEQSILKGTLDDFILEWQFISLIPQAMGMPIPQKRTSGPVRLTKDGSNIAEYLLSIRKLDQSVFDGIVETLQYILPYARDLQPALTSELERTVYLQMTEGEFKVPGWLLSTGTLRIVALLALFRHPTPPPVIIIEEIENGLDPRTIHLLVDEIRNAIESGRTQVILTTHSPYLLDLLDLSHIILVDRVDGKPTFTRPADQTSLQEWAKDFSPGRLYTMDLLGRKAGA